MGEDAKTYIEAGISTDHECFTIEEAVDKLSYGMKILIREGSAAKNFEALYELIDDHPNSIMLCSDDKHPDSLVLGHINQLCARAVAKGLNIFNILKAACVNPVIHYKLPTGLARVNDPANFIIVEDLIDFKVAQTYINGQLVAENGTSFINTIEEKIINQFDTNPIKTEDIQVAIDSYPVKENKIAVIEAIDGQLITNCLWETPTILEEMIVSDTNRDILKMVVYNRYYQAASENGFY
jgi:adenine deaminase